jgi:hypothetical protein
MAPGPCSKNIAVRRVFHSENRAADALSPIIPCQRRRVLSRSSKPPASSSSPRMEAALASGCGNGIH